MTTPNPIDEVRGSDDDALWSARAEFALAWAGVPAARIDEEIAAVAQQMRDSGQGPRELHGTPGEFARERVRALAADGVPLGFDGPQGASPVDDAEWLKEVRRALVRRGDLLPGQIDGKRREVEVHAREAGSTLWEEFGSPRAFVALLPLDIHRPRMRTALVQSALSISWIIFVLCNDFAQWARWLMVVFWIISATKHWFDYLRDVRRWRQHGQCRENGPTTRGARK